MKSSQKRRSDARPTITGRRTGKQGLHYDKLEARNLLASTLYVDFGIGTGDLTINDAQSQSLGGPQVFGSGHTLESLQTTITNSELDLNFDNQLDATDTDAFIAQVMENVAEIFEVFDVTVQQVNSTSLTDVALKLAEQTTNDTYIFVGGSNPIEAVDFGASLIDPGNTSDNLGFVFAKEVFEFWPEDASNYYGLNFEIAPRMGWAVARYIAKHTGHSYGLLSTEATNSQAESDVMRSPGTDSNGDDLPFSGFRARQSTDGSPGVFTRYAHDLSSVNGVTPGVQNSYEAMVSAVGTKADAPYYITGFGRSDPRITVRSNASGSLTIEADEEVFRPTIEELEHGLLINTGGQVRLGELPNHTIEVKNVRYIIIDQTLDFGFDGTADRSIFRSRLEIIPVDRTNYFGTINDNISYDSVETLSGSDGNDIFRFFPTINVTGIEESPGIFQSDIHLANDIAYGRDGNDIFILNRQTYVASGGNGDDFFRNEGGDAVVKSGGTGFDIVEYTTGNDWNFLLLRTRLDSFDMAGGFGTGDNGIDRFSFLAGASATLENYSSNDIMGEQSFSWIHNGDRTIVYEPLTKSRVEFTGVISKISGGSNDFVFIRSTEFDLQVSGPGYIQFSSEFDPTLGHTDDIQHRVNLDIASDGRLVIGAKAGSGVQALVTDDFLSGLTGNLIVFDSEQPDVIVHGSDIGSDFIAIASSTSRYALFGYGGNDFFSVGYAFGGEEARLNLVQGIVQLDGGSGNDLVLIRDQDTTHLEISNRYVSKSTSFGPSPRFAFIQYDNFETFRANVKNDNPDGFYSARIWGSPNTTYHIATTSREAFPLSQPDTKDLILIGGDPNDGRVFFVANEPASEPSPIRGGVWVFADVRKPIFISRINEIV